MYISSFNSSASSHSCEMCCVTKPILLNGIVFTASVITCITSSYYCGRPFLDTSLNACIVRDLSGAFALNSGAMLAIGLSKKIYSYVSDRFFTIDEDRPLLAVN